MGLSFPLVLCSNLIKSLKLRMAVDTNRTLFFLPWKLWGHILRLPAACAFPGGGIRHKVCMIQGKILEGGF